MQTVLEAARDLLRTGGRGVLALVCSSSGSAPRGAGAKMLVTSDGTLDTIGGGPVEWEVQHRARQLLEQGETQVLEFDLHGSDVEGSEAICGGGVSVCLHPLSAADLPALEAACEAAVRRERTYFLLWQTGPGLCVSCCVTPRGVVTHESLEAAGEEIARVCESAGIHEEPRLLYQEQLASGSRVWLMGGGHVALATAQVAAVAGFDVVVVDDRAEFANQTRFPGARCIVCQAYDALPADEVTDTDYIVVVTRGHKADREALEWALGTRACYVGMIGSKSKCALIYQALREQGVPQARLDWVHGPIGLPIGGRTPGEIAVSIVAQLIQVRTSLEGGGGHGA